MKLTTFLLVSILATLALMATCKPVWREQANQQRKAASLARGNQRRLSKRQSTDAGPTDTPVPRYIQELYNNLTREEGGSTPSSIESTANTIRLLKNVAAEPSCNIFNFSLSAIGSHELAIKATLHLYMVHTETTPPLPGPFYIMVRELEKSDNEETDFVSSLEILHKASGWVTFDVQDRIAVPIKNGESHVGFKIQIYQSTPDGPHGLLNCNDGPITFKFSPTDEEKAPYLTVQSHDSQVDEIDYKTILDHIESETQQDLANGVSRRRRSTTITTNTVNLPTCQVNDLHIRSSEIPLRGGRILQRTGDYNAGICGGQCRNTNPKYSKHSQLVHYLVASRGLSSYPAPGEGLQGTFEQLCSPVQYTSLSVIFLPDDTLVPEIKRLQNMKIKRCDCLEVVKFAKAR